MNAPISLVAVFILLLFNTCKSQKTDSMAFLSRDFYKSFNFGNSNPDTEKKYQLWNWTYKRYDTVYDIKPDEKLYAIIDSIPPVELTKNQVNKIHFWSHEDRKKLFRYYKIDSLNNLLHLDSLGREMNKNYYNHYQNYYVIEKVGDKYYKYKVFRRRRVVE